MKKHNVLVLLAHPKLYASVINKTMVHEISALDHVLVHDLYERYPDFYLDIDEEKRLAQEADLIVFQSPFYWYSTTPLLKLWQDEVLEQGFAYGEGGDALQGKDFMLALSTGGKLSAYDRQGYNYFTMDELLTPFIATANLCGMHYQQPLVIHGSYTQTDEHIQQHAERYRSILEGYVEKGQAVFDMGG